MRLVSLRKSLITVSAILLSASAAATPILFDGSAKELQTDWVLLADGREVPVWKDGDTLIYPSGIGPEDLADACGADPCVRAQVWEPETALLMALGLVAFGARRQSGIGKR